MKAITIEKKRVLSSQMLTQQVSKVFALVIKWVIKLNPENTPFGRGRLSLRDKKNVDFEILVLDIGS